MMMNGNITLDRTPMSPPNSGLDIRGKRWAIIALLLANGAIAQADENRKWSAFQNGGQLALPACNIPTEWSIDKNLAWAADVPGHGQSTPIIAHQQMVVTSTSGGNKETYHVASYAVENGKKLWQVDIPNPSPYENTPMVSRAAPSAIATEEGFIAFFEGGSLIALTPKGDRIWEKDLVAEYGKIEARHGIASSLEQNAQHVFVWVERMEDPYVLAIDKKTGELAWKSSGVGSTTWSSPRLIPVGESEHLVCSASGKIIGLDPATGARKWELGELTGNTSCTPVPAGNGRFVIGASDGRGATTGNAVGSSNGLVEIKPKDDGTFQAAFVWRAAKASATFGSPVVTGNSVLIVNRAGVLFHLDLATGKELNTIRTSAGGLWGTPLVIGDFAYLFGYKGTTAVVRLSDGVEVAKNELWQAAEASGEQGSVEGSILYAAAPAAPYLILRSGEKLYAVKQH